MERPRAQLSSICGAIASAVVDLFRLPSREQVFKKAKCVFEELQLHLSLILLYLNILLCVFAVYVLLLNIATNAEKLLFNYFFKLSSLQI